ncbi:MAG: L-threonine 3-dehydrogenase, partial [Chlamydiia bacterium]|nr:L-threonine 3-dehydrogenase [Chlamydiia bacterium]
MKAIVKYPKEGLSFEEVSMPEPKPDEVLIKTKLTSICGTDLHIYKWDEWAKKNVPAPMVIGHEFVGEIAALGSQVTDHFIGERVCGEGHFTCGHCLGCRNGQLHLCSNTIGLGIRSPGCYAEYFTFPARNLYPLPDTITDELGAIFDPFGNAVHTALSAPLAGADVLITGAGPIGIMAAAVAKHAGAHCIVITDINDWRLNLASQMGATLAVNVAKTPLKEATRGIDFTVGMEMSGHPQALSDQLHLLQPGSHLALLGILPPNTAIDWDLIVFKMLHIKGIYGS